MTEGIAPPWWKTAVFYQIYPRSFRDSNADGIGDLVGITQRLDYLVTLGVDAIWVSPFYPSPQVDFGYDVADHCEVDPCYGDLAAFDRLLAAAHERGLRVILDYVANHTSDRHAWFLGARSSREDPRRDWYVWRDPAPDGGPPNNWVGVFGGSAWTLDDATGQYYLHSFHPAQPDLNWRNPEVERAMTEVLRFWLDRGVDGVRIDAPEYMGKDPALPDNPRRARPAVHRRGVVRPYDALEHLHDKDHPDLHAIFRRLRAVVDGYPERVTIGEVRIRDRRRWAAYYGQGDELHLVFDFAPLKATWTAVSIREAVEDTQRALPAGTWPALALGNHDERRIATRYGTSGARMAAVLLLTLPGTPFVYYGDELGMVDVELLPEQMRDPQAAIDPAMSRDPCRTPMPWTPENGFTEPGVKPWLPMGRNREEKSVARQLGVPDSMLEHYHALLAVRRRTPALACGSYESHPGSDDALYLFWRHHGEQRVLVALNFGDEMRALPPECAGARVLATTETGTPPSDTALDPGQAIVLEVRR